MLCEPNWVSVMPQGAEESEVLFTLIAERYERRSLGITSNLVVPRQLYLPVGVNQFCRFTSLAWTRCWAALVR